MMGAMALPPSSKYLQRAHDPVDEVERESLTQRLNAAFSDGRISHGEYAAGMDVIYDAQTLGDLVPVIERLPAAAANVPAIVEQSGPPAGQVTSSRNLMPLMGVVGVVGVVLLTLLAVLIVVLIF